MSRPSAPAPAEAPYDVWNDGMRPGDTSTGNVKEVREWDNSKTSIYNQGKLVRDGTAPATAEDAQVALEGNSLNDLLKWSIGNAKEEDIASLRDCVARGEYDPRAYREFLDVILGEGDLVTMKKKLKEALDDATPPEGKVAALEEVEYLTESIDNANDLIKAGGLDAVMGMLNDTDVRIANAAAGVLTTCMQNNPKGQKFALSKGLIPTLLLAIRDAREQARVPPLLSAVSALARTNPAGASALMNLNGIELLALLGAAGEVRVQRKALFLLSVLAAETPGAAAGLRGAPRAAQAVLDALGTEDHDVQAHALACILHSMQGLGVDYAERVASREWWAASDAERALKDLAVRLQSKLQTGEADDSDDPTVPLQVAKILALIAGELPLGEPPVAAAAPPPVLPGGSALPGISEQPLEQGAGNAGVAVAVGGDAGAESAATTSAAPAPQVAMLSLT